MLHFPEAMWTAGATYAAWTFGLVSILLNVGGLWFIWKQLKANERALQSAGESAEAAKLAAAAAVATSRPWLTFEVHSAWIFVYPDQPDTIGCQINYRIENIGQTPALDARIVFRPVGAEDALAVPDREAVKNLFSAIEKDIFGSSRALFPREKRDGDLATNFPWPAEWLNPHCGGSSFKVYAAVLYRSAEGGTYHRTAFASLLQKKAAATPEYYPFKPDVKGSFECITIHLGDETPSPT